VARTQPDQQASESGEARLRRWIDLPASQVVLDPTRVREHGHPRERPALLVSLIIVLLLVLGALWHQDFVVLSGIAVVWMSMTLLALQAPTVHTLGGAAITPTQFSKVYEIFEEVARQFNAPPTEAFVIRDSRAQAHAYGVRAPYTIVFHSALLDALDPDELRFIIGQQLGRIVYGHTRMTVFIGGEAESLPALLGQFTWLRDLFFAWYRRVSLLSADRAGALACGDMEVAVRTLVKLSVGNNEFHAMRADDLVDQVYRVNQGVNRVQASLIWATSTVPPHLRRVQELVVWGGLPKQRAALTEATTAPPAPRPEGEPAPALTRPEQDEGGGR
jgi:Zn-dependent protease with chaperone function